MLAGRGLKARVVSLPSWELFDAQPQAYRDAVLPPSVLARVAVEAGVPQGWERYVGPFGAVVGIENRFGASAPVKVVMEKLRLHRRERRRQGRGGRGPSARLPARLRRVTAPA